MNLCRRRIVLVVLTLCFNTIGASSSSSSSSSSSVRGSANPKDKTEHVDEMLRMQQELGGAFASNMTTTTTAELRKRMKQELVRRRRVVFETTSSTTTRRARSIGSRSSRMSMSMSLATPAPTSCPIDVRYIFFLWPIGQNLDLVVGLFFSSIVNRYI